MDRHSSQNTDVAGCLVGLLVIGLGIVAASVTGVVTFIWHIWAQ